MDYEFSVYKNIFLFQEEKLKAYRKERKKDKKRKASAIDEDSGMDPEMAKVMGFGGFGSSKKS